MGHSLHIHLFYHVLRYRAPWFREVTPQSVPPYFPYPILLCSYFHGHQPIISVKTISFEWECSSNFIHHPCNHDTAGALFQRGIHTLLFIKVCNFAAINHLIIAPFTCPSRPEDHMTLFRRWRIITDIFMKCQNERVRDSRGFARNLGTWFNLGQRSRYPKLDHTVHPTKVEHNVPASFFSDHRLINRFTRPVRGHFLACPGGRSPLKDYEGTCFGNSDMCGAVRDDLLDYHATSNDGIKNPVRDSSHRLCIVP